MLLATALKGPSRAWKKLGTAGPFDPKSALRLSSWIFTFKTYLTWATVYIK